MSDRSPEPDPNNASPSRKEKGGGSGLVKKLSTDFASALRLDHLHGRNHLIPMYPGLIRPATSTFRDTG